MTPEQSKELLAVTDADREAAADYFRVQYGEDSNMAVTCFSDAAFPLVQAFARHRQSSEGELVRVLDWLRSNSVFVGGAMALDEKFGIISDEDGDNFDWRTACLFLAEQIERLVSCTCGEVAGEDPNCPAHSEALSRLTTDDLKGRG